MPSFIAICGSASLIRRMADGGVREAKAGSLPREAYRGLLVLRTFYDRDLRELDGVLGVDARHSELTSKIIREVLIAFGEDRIERLAFYQTACLDLSSKFATRYEILNLAARHLLILRRQQTGNVLEIVPTERLVAFYAAKVPALLHEMSGLFLSWEDLAT